MDNNKYYYIDFEEKIENLLKKGEFLGSGHNGIVFLLPGNKIIKIFKDEKICQKEYHILQRVKDSKKFPTVYDYGQYYIIRDYVEGERLDKYIEKYGLNEKIAHNIIELIKEFKRLNFSKLDIRCKDLYITEDFYIKVIDPKNNYSKRVVYPRHLMKGLNKIGVLEEFLEYVKKEEIEFYNLWSYRMKQYLEKGIK